MLKADRSVYSVAGALDVSRSTLWRYTHEVLLPALLAAGLLRHAGHLRLPKGSYGMTSVLLL